MKENIVEATVLIILCATIVIAIAILEQPKLKQIELEKFYAKQGLEKIYNPKTKHYDWKHTVKKDIK